ncbi:hypothetical protein [Noviherbaspirillum aerium]|uniref:hypothetical protein n=1 Tax=Noviherbaspirillum aerium TaxID=2588497 RepID=UPI00124C8699|nr:hypothetical protein [Noviherbaspirillum aerium]
MNILHDGASFAGERVGVARGTKQHLPSLAADAAASGEALLRQVMDYYHARLKQIPDALAQWAARPKSHHALKNSTRPSSRS